MKGSDRVHIVQPAQGMAEYWQRVDSDPLSIVMVERIVLAGNPRGSGQLKVKVNAFSTMGRALGHVNADGGDGRFVIYTLRLDDPEWLEREMDS